MRISSNKNTRLEMQQHFDLIQDKSGQGSRLGSIMIMMAKEGKQKLKTHVGKGG